MNIHFIGIGGISMSGLASICLNRGDFVSGSDNLSNKLITELQSKGAIIHIGHKESNIPSNTDLVVYTAAIKHDNPELVKANNLGIQIMNRAVFLGALMKEFHSGIAISGTHGKTSTTSMVSSIFLSSNRNPTISVGGNLKEIGGNFRVGGNNYFITEACEYVDSFLSLHPKYCVILNIEHEHIDYFKDLQQIQHSFRQFAQNCSNEGKVIGNGDDAAVKESLDGLPNVIFFGMNESNDCKIKNCMTQKFGNTFELELFGNSLGVFEIHVIGTFNIQNATAAILCAYFSGVELEDIRKGIASYVGVGRRFEYIGKYNGASVYDDYAHHPSEVKATLSAAKSIRTNRLITIFQPHTFSRTYSLMNEFAASFVDTDILVVADIYPSREIDTGYVHSKDLVDQIAQHQDNVYYFSSNHEIEQFIDQIILPDDILVTMGAGDINVISYDLVSPLEQK